MRSSSVLLALCAALLLAAPAASRRGQGARVAASRLRGGVDAASFQQQYWIPLESSPEVFNDFARRVGVGAGYAFTDVLGLDAELLAMLPQPCVAVLLLFPVSRELARSESARVRALGGWDVRRRSPRVFFMKQYVGNACGTVAAMHALVNNRDVLSVGSGPLREMLPAEPAEGGEAVGECEEGDLDECADELGERLSASSRLMAASESSAQLGGTVPQVGALPPCPVSHIRALALTTTHPDCSPVPAARSGCGLPLHLLRPLERRRLPLRTRRNQAFPDQPRARRRGPAHWSGARDQGALCRTHARRPLQRHGACRRPRRHACCRH